MNYLIDASSIITREHVVGTWLWCWAIVQCNILIGSVHTIWISVAQPFPRNTLSTTPRLVLLARKLCLFVALTIV